jgi:hypothetical protein
MVTAHAGETLICRIRVTDPVKQRVVSDAEVVASFFARDRDPGADLPDHVTQLSYDAESRVYLARVPTEGWVPGMWTFWAHVSGGPAPGYKTRTRIQSLELTE